MMNYNVPNRANSYSFEVAMIVLPATLSPPNSPSMIVCSYCHVLAASSCVGIITSQASDEESARARAEMKALSTVRQERDSLALKVGDVEQQLQEAQDNIQSLEQLLQDAQEEAGARESLGELEAENTSLQAEIETLRKQDNESHTQEKQVEDMATLRAQLEATHVEEMARVRAQLVSEADSQREEEAQRVQEMVTRLEEAGREAGHLRAQLQKEQERASALDAQLAQTSTQLDDEQAGKKVGRAC